MTTQGPQHQGETEDPFASLSPYEFVLLTTFRKSGVGVPTAMWFAYEHGKLYMVTGHRQAQAHSHDESRPRGSLRLDGQHAWATDRSLCA